MPRVIEAAEAMEASEAAEMKETAEMIDEVSSNGEEFIRTENK